MTKYRWTSSGILILYLLFASCFLFFTPGPASAAANQPVVMGYYVKDWYNDYGSYNSLATYHSNLDYTATFSALIDWNGNLIMDFPPTEGIDLAKKKGVKPLLVVHNMNNGMDSWTVSAVLGDANKRWNLSQNIVWLVKKYGFAGVNIDLEAVPTWNRDDYNKFLWELKGLLKPGGYLLTAAVPAKNSDQWDNAWSGAYDYRELNRVCDYVMLMTYDEHWFGGSPGPIASLPWVQSVLDYAVKQMNPQKILLGLAAYGYDWSWSGTRAVKWKDVNELANQYGAQIQWDNYSSSPYFYYWIGNEQHEVWFENKYSLAIKLGLVKSYGLGGVSLWRLGMEDYTLWNTIQNKL
ncbi:glycoside hydrolase family 18 [Desulfotomaculum nigrificans CO-1-SRB]|uniref:Glycoside hydrolase family 18 n=1 Tax=Desulfotomaculum nigrificans (strain DSM 14880 / VKM B-2319 / CO-1-SRB) TaxID=868595 RepID=F6B3P0_DESCC|nr:glycosyl hydrolase family 18 protein [Desulfotomaculum nigrificans]AEF95199.1 glycoside hydrolase family 18 [Desulfotomaculum nigrificans CO-1-SRB]